MASGSCQGCEEEDEETLKKLIVRLNNVQEGKQIETLVQILEDLLVFTYADHGNHLQANCLLPPIPHPRAASFANFLSRTLELHRPGLLRSHKRSLLLRARKELRIPGRSCAHFCFRPKRGCVNPHFASFPLPPSFPASKLFQGKNVHVPVLIVLDLYMRVASVQQVKEFSCCPFPLLFGNMFFCQYDVPRSAGLFLTFGLTDH